jgi:hypothetical protein
MSWHTIILCKRLKAYFTQLCHFENTSSDLTNEKTMKALDHHKLPISQNFNNILAKIYELQKCKFV